MMEISAASAFTIIFARNIHKVRDFLAIATIMSWENGFYVEIHNFRYVEITRKQDRKIIIMIMIIIIWFYEIW